MDDNLQPGELELTGDDAGAEAGARAEGDAPAAGDNPSQGKEKLTDAERLVKLAQQAADRPTFASDRKTTEPVNLPNGDGWFVPRPLTREEVLKLESIQARARTWMTPGDNMDKARPVDTQAKRDEYYSFLCGVGISKYEFKSTANGEVHRGEYRANAASRPTEGDFNGLDPVLGEWVQFYLEVWNGISEDQRRERGNT
jgi:hypothetical protein